MGALFPSVKSPRFSDFYRREKHPCAALNIRGWLRLSLCTRGEGGRFLLCTFPWHGTMTIEFVWRLWICMTTGNLYELSRVRTVQKVPSRDQNDIPMVNNSSISNVPEHEKWKNSQNSQNSQNSHFPNNYSAFGTIRCWENGRKNACWGHYWLNSYPRMRFEHSCNTVRTVGGI